MGTMFNCIAIRVLCERSQGHAVLEVHFDRFSTFDSDKFKARLLSELHVRAKIGSSKRHEDVGSEEVNGDLITRMTEAAHCRARAYDPTCSDLWYLPCREYMQIVLNPDTPHYCSECSYLVGVRGFGASAFSVGFTRDDASMRLRAGVPSSFLTTSAHRPVYFRFELSAATPLTISVTPTGGAMW